MTAVTSNDTPRPPPPTRSQQQQSPLQIGPQDPDGKPQASVKQERKRKWSEGDGRDTLSHVLSSVVSSPVGNVTAEEKEASLWPTKRARADKTHQLQQRQQQQPVLEADLPGTLRRQFAGSIMIETSRSHEEDDNISNTAADNPVDNSYSDHLALAAQRLWSPTVLDEQLQILQDDREELRDPLINLISAFALACRPDIMVLDSTNLAWLSQGPKGSAEREAGGNGGEASPRTAQQPAAMLQIRDVLQLPDKSLHPPKIFFGYNKEHHWRAVLIDIPSRTIAVADPIKPDLVPPQHFIQDLEDESGLLQTLFGGSNNTSSSSLLCSPSQWTCTSLDIPAQAAHDSVNCGIYVLVTALSLGSSQSPPKSLDPHIWRRLFRALLEPIEGGVTLHSLLAKEKVFDILPEEMCSDTMPVPQHGQMIADVVQALARFARDKVPGSKKLQGHIDSLDKVLDQVRQADTIITALVLAGAGCCTELERTAREIRDKIEERKKLLAGLQGLKFFGWSTAMAAQCAIETRNVNSLLRIVERRHAILVGGNEHLEGLAAGVRYVIVELEARVKACRAAHEAIALLSVIAIPAKTN